MGLHQFFKFETLRKFSIGWLAIWNNAELYFKQTEKFRNQLKIPISKFGFKILIFPVLYSKWLTIQYHFFQRIIRNS